jgi:micrococcal nuclease
MGRHRAKNTTLSLIVLVIAGLFILAQYYGWLASAKQAAVVSQPGLYNIDHFVDGDTIAVKMNGAKEIVRFIGVDTPETHKPNTPVQCYGPAAAGFTKNSIGTGSVRLEADPLNTDRDRYGRLLRYVYLQDGRLLNEVLIQNGYGFYYPYFPFGKKAQFAADEKQAMAAHKGLWGNCSPTPTDSGGYVSNTAT